MARRGVDLDWAKNIKSTKDKRADYVSAIVWGDYGSGKTKFCSTWPNVIFIACEDGMLTVWDKDIPYILINPEKAINQTMLDILATAAVKGGVFQDKQTIVLDSMSKLNRLMKDEILEESGKEAPEFDDWGKLRTRMNRINNILTTLPYNILVISTETYKKDEYDKKIKPEFNIDGGFRDDFPGEYDNVWYCSKRQIGNRQKFFMNTENFEGRQQKRRLPLPDEIENADYTQIMTKVKETFK